MPEPLTPEPQAPEPQTPEPQTPEPQTLVPQTPVPQTLLPAGPEYQRADLVKAVTIYSLLRFGLFVALTAIFTIFLPLLVAMAFAVIGQLPLSMLLFSAQKQRMVSLMAQGPGAEKAKLRASLRGDQ